MLGSQDRQRSPDDIIPVEMVVTQVIVIVDPCTAARMIEIVTQVRAAGVVQGQDFDFAFCPAQQINFFGTFPSFAEFTFYTNSMATWFRLKYA